MPNYEMDSFKKINTIIERDSKDTTYKFALLRAVIEISQEYPHLKKEKNGKVAFPLGLLVEKWLFYYYPLIESSEFMPQKNGESAESGKQIAFRTDFKRITEYYKDKGGFSAFNNDYQNDTIPKQVVRDFLMLIKTLRRTITNMPMRYIGRSISKDEYSIFTFNDIGSQSHGVTSINTKYLIDALGTFSFNKEFYEVFLYLGGFISGEDSLLYKWAEFTVGADKTGALTVESVLKKLRTFPATERIIRKTQIAFEHLLRDQHYLKCVWSGELVTSAKSLNIDHVIPFSIWKNNDLWNLVPVKREVNLKKRDRVPSPEFIEKRRGDIIFYWDFLRSCYEAQFDRQIAVSLIGKQPDQINWQDAGIDQLKTKCDYLIGIRGIDGWSM